MTQTLYTLSEETIRKLARDHATLREQVARLAEQIAASNGGGRDDTILAKPTGAVAKAYDERTDEFGQQQFKVWDYAIDSGVLTTELEQKTREETGYNLAPYRVGTSQMCYVGRHFRTGRWIALPVPWAPQWFELKDGQTLAPGSSATAYRCFWSGSAWVADVHADNEFTIYDPEYRTYAFGISGHLEHVQVGLHPSNGRYETVGEWGLFRKGKTDSTVTAGSSGTVSLWLGSDTGLNVTAYLDWVDGGGNISSAKECFVTYRTDERKWQFTGADC